MNAASSFTILPLGDSALLISFGNVIDEQINTKILSLFYKIKSLSLNGIKDVVPAYSSLAVYYDLLVVRQKTSYNRTAFDIIEEKIKKIIDENDLNDGNDFKRSTRKIKIPVCYAEKYALDINDISVEKNLSVDDIIKLHTEKSYRVYVIGFLPGFAYMGKVDEKIAMPRKAQPRLKVEAGHVGIAGKQTGIYPVDSPGGWQIIGKTPLRLFDKENVHPILFQPGDEVEFYSIKEDEFTNY